MTHQIDPTFKALPYQELSAAALDEAKKLGASYADFRFERIRSQSVSVRDTSLERLVNNVNIGYAVRVVHNGSWGFASGVLLNVASARQVTAQAVALAKALFSLNSEPVELAEEPTYKSEYISDYEIDPFDISDQEKIDFLLKINRQVLDSKKIEHVDFGLKQVLENKFFANLEGSNIVQQRVRLQGDVEALKTSSTGSFETMRSLASPVARGWEFISRDYDYAKEAAELPEMLEEKMAAPSVEPGKYDLVIDPSNLWLTIHESIGHATELDRVLGYEANYAGTSFATLDKLNKLQYGSKIMNVTGDRVAPNGLASIGYDDEGVETSKWDIIKDGVLVGYQLNRQMAKKHGYSRSNGCAFADSPHHVPLQRMANVSLQPSGELTLDDLIGRVENGIFIAGNKSWSIDMQRYNFQFTGQRFYKIKNGKLAGQLKDVAYQATTTDFWNSLEAVGGPDTYLLGGAFNCGKGQPGQIAPVSHGAPATLFRNINILNTEQEAKK
jgi:TldD protein